MKRDGGAAAMKIRILDVCWHIGHQYEMLKFPFVEWSWLAQYVRLFNPASRGRLEGMMRHVPYYEPGKYDAAILHLDQECILPAEWQWGKGAIYREMDEAIQDIPKIVIMHGSPYAPEALPTPAIVDKVRTAVGRNYMVVNSHEAARQWGWGEVIIHGMDAGEWWDLPKQPRVLTVLSPQGMPAYYDRPFLEDVRKELMRRDIVHCQIGRDYVARNWDVYRRVLGSSLIYFNPTAEAPMPRARTEAMLSGCCVLTTPSHDAGSYIENGRNGYLVDRNPVEVANLVESLLHDPAKAVSVGRNGKQTAEQRFDWRRFAGQWEQFLGYVIDDYRSANGGRRTYDSGADSSGYPYVRTNVA